MCEVWYCVPGMAIDTSSGTGCLHPINGVLLLDELAMTLYDAMDFTSEEVHYKKVVCIRGYASFEIRTADPQHLPLAEST